MVQLSKILTLLTCSMNPQLDMRNSKGLDHVPERRIIELLVDGLHMLQPLRSYPPTNVVVHPSDSQLVLNCIFEVTVTYNSLIQRIYSKICTILDSAFAIPSSCHSRTPMLSSVIPDSHSHPQSAYSNPSSSPSQDLSGRHRLSSLPFLHNISHISTHTPFGDLLPT